ncbi:hypothetical protein [uncultured Apibacter sp.]|uniref:hypothetical protein n=1 Tax=uncultured Apibacter sp. TaxID=1778616 RepID=UPI0025FE3164|nr:hypothetical protein [uncultured Apibacter sp.]
MRNRIWSELTQSKHNIEYICLYIDHQNLKLKIFNIFTLLFSSAGIMGWKFWDYMPVIACIIIAIVSLLKLIQPHLIPTEKEIKDLDSIHNFYEDYYNKLEKLWYTFENEIINEEKATKEFYYIKKTELTINSLVNNVLKSKPKKLINKAKESSDSYFEQTFYNKQ